MNSIFSFVVGLLTAALSLLGFVQQHPELPQSSRDQAQQIAQQAITQATNALNNANTQSTAPAQSSSGNITGNAENGYSGTFSANPATGNAPLTVKFNSTIQSAGDISIDYGDGSSCSTANPDGSQNCALFTHTYSNAGTFTAILYRHLPTTELARLTITVGGSGTSNISVSGMTKYTDSNFGFSFWYPSGWTVELAGPPSKSPDFYYPGGTLQKSYNIKNSNGEFIVALNEIYSEGRTITDTGGAGPYGPVTYYFDTALHQWMKTGDVGGGDVPQAAIEAGKVPKPADISRNTMGGLHMFSGTSRYYSTIIPLSAHNFVVAISPNGMQIEQLIKTILALDPSVTTPVSAAQQTATIQAEATAYGI